MCRSKRSTDVKSQPSSSANPSSSSSINNPLSSSSSLNFSSNQFYRYSNSSSSSSFSAKPSRKNLLASLPENPNIYDFAEICRAANNFLSKPFSSSSSSSSWRCRIRHKDVILFRRKFRGRDPIELTELQRRLSAVCRSHHSSLVKLLGASVSGNCIYLVYDFVHGADLAACLRNRRNPNFTILSTWLSRMQVATDTAHGLEYIHNSGFVHNHIKSSSIVVAEDTLNAKICHFGTAELCGEIENSEAKIEGTIGYMAPEYQSTGAATKKGDVYACGVVLLERVSGEEALRYVVEEKSGGFKRARVIERGSEAVAGGEKGVRNWVDGRLRDSFPVEVAVRVVGVGLECVEEVAERRPEMEEVVIRVSRLYLESKNWAEKFGLPTDFSVSMAPR